MLAGLLIAQLVPISSWSGHVRTLGTGAQEHAAPLTSADTPRWLQTLPRKAALGFVCSYPATPDTRQ